MAQLITYHGNCHCGRYRFDLPVSEIKSAITCSCSLCEKKGAIWLKADSASLKVIRDDGYLTEYQSASLHDKVCYSFLFFFTVFFLYSIQKKYPNNVL
jgi:hypothetical protein